MAVEILGKRILMMLQLLCRITRRSKYEHGSEEFAINTMKGVKEENLILALLNTYNMGNFNITAY